MAGNQAPAPMLAAGQTIRLKSKNTGAYVRINSDEEFDALGGDGQYPVLKVNPTDKGHLRFESTKLPGKFLSHKGSPGTGGSHTHFVAHPTGNPNEFIFRSPDGSVALGFSPDGKVKDPSNVGNGPAGTMTVEHFHPYLQSGRQVRLMCKSTGKYARIRADGELDGLGGDGDAPLMKVNPSENGYLRFESVKFPGKFLSHKGSPGTGGSHTEFVVNSAGDPDEFHLRSPDNSVALGFTPDGKVKDPSQVGRGKHGIFTVVKV